MDYTDGGGISARQCSAGVGVSDCMVWLAEMLCRLGLGLGLGSVVSAASDDQGADAEVRDPTAAADMTRPVTEIAGRHSMLDEWPRLRDSSVLHAARCRSGGAVRVCGQTGRASLSTEAVRQTASQLPYQPRPLCISIVETSHQLSSRINWTLTA